MKTIKILLVIMCAIPLMGNEGCESKKPKERILRLSADAGRILGQTVKLPDNRVIDFPFVANSLFYLTVMQDPHFLIDRPITVGYPSEDSGSMRKVSSFENTDTDLLMKYGFKFKSKPSAGGGVSQKPGDNLPQCIHTAPEVKLTGAVVSFELIGGAGVNVGYVNGVQLPSPGMGGSIHFENSRLDVVLRTDDPLTEKPITVDQGYSYETKIDGSFNYMGMIGLDFFFKTPIVSAVANALKDALANLVKVYHERLNAKTWNEVWTSKVIFDPAIVDGDTHIALRGGWRANIRKGDTFSIYNMHYKWLDAPCTSRLDYAIQNPLYPVAEVVIVEAGQDVSVARVVSQSTDYNVIPGAAVRVKALAP